MMSRKGFTLMEVLVATAVAGLVITAGFRLIAMSYRLLGEIQGERELIAAAQEVWLRFRIDADIPDSGANDEKGYSWSTEKGSITIDEYELGYKKVTVRTAAGRSTVIYVSE